MMMMSKRVPHYTTAKGPSHCSLFFLALTIYFKVCMVHARTKLTSAVFDPRTSSTMARLMVAPATVMLAAAIMASATSAVAGHDVDVATLAAVATLHEAHGDLERTQFTHWTPPCSACVSLQQAIQHAADTGKPRYLVRWPCPSSPFARKPLASGIHSPALHNTDVTWP
jgi:hypothetical protein